MRVFMVEDSKPMQSLLTDLLSSVGGFEVIEAAATELAATEWLEAHEGEWHLATLDLVLSDGSGFNLIKRCRDHAARDGKIVVFSDFVMPGIERKCKELGADAVIRKSEYKLLTDYCAQLQTA